LENPVAATTLESCIFRLASDVIIPSAELRPYLIRRGVQPSRLRVIPNAADPERFPNRPARSNRREFVVGFLGSLKPWHGLENLVRAFRRLHRRFDGYRLLIAGDGPLRAPLQKELRAHGLSSATRFRGEVSRADVADVLAEMDVAVAPYPRLAGFYFSPLKVYEYMAAGLPIVASDIGQISAVLTHGKTALLHRPGAVAPMVQSIEQLRRDPALATRLAGNARRLLRRRFTWGRNAERVVSMIERRRTQLRGATSRSRRS
jgi:glycosyltransferase involved in cell wall biosynthesis